MRVLAQTRPQPRAHKDVRGRPARRRAGADQQPRLVTKSSGRDLSGAHVVVLGLGSSGLAATHLALLRGARVTALDQNEAADRPEDVLDLPRSLRGRCKTVLGPHPPSLLDQGSDLLILSPGVPLASAYVQQAVQAGLQVISELAFAAQDLPRSVAITAITGTNGKSTTTLFTAQLLRAACHPEDANSIWAGGNLGTPLSTLAASMHTGQACRHAVVEVSSYQLEAPGTFTLDAACILNLTPDHLERHGSIETYAATKLRLFQHMRASAPRLASLDMEHHVPHSLRRTSQQARQAASAHTPHQRMGGAGSLQHAGEITWLDGSLPGVRVAAESITLQLRSWREAQTLRLGAHAPPGAHNRTNAAVAAYLALSVEPSLSWDSVCEAVPRLVLPPHRMQLVGHALGVPWYNDSKATNVAAAQAALSSLTAPGLVLLGGKGKRDPSGRLGFQDLAPALQTQAGVILFGADAELIRCELQVAGVRVAATSPSLEAATRCAAAMVHTVAASSVLLTPGCASFDEFRNFEHRGQMFEMYVDQLE